MSINKFLEKLRQMDVLLEVSGGSLKINAPKEFLTDDLLIELKERKDSIVKHFARVEKQEHSTIRAVEKKDYYPLSPAQKRLYSLQRFDPGNVLYNLPYQVLLPAGINHKKIENVFIRLINRHESLRTSFHMKNEMPVQRIRRQVPFEIEIFDEKRETRGESTGSPTYLKKIINNFTRSFDLSKAPLLRAGFVRTAKGVVLLIDMHHIISDGISQGILENEFAALFAGQNTLPPLKLHYKDYSEWQGGFEQQKITTKQGEYWLREFRGELPVLNLPYDFERPKVQDLEGAYVSFSLNHKETEGLNVIAKRYQVTLFMTLLSVFSILLSKISGQDDIIVGSPAAGRRHTGLTDIIGMFVNTFVSRNRPQDDMTFIDFLNRVKENTLTAFENQDYPFEELVSKLSLPRDTGRNPVFDVFFALQNQAGRKVEQSDYNDTNIHKTGVTSKFDLSLDCILEGDMIRCTCEYAAKLFESETIERFIDYFRRVIKGVIENPEVKISGIDILSESEKYRLLHDFNDTEKAYPGSKIIQRLFREQVESAPGHTSVVFEDRVLTYEELNHRANRLAGLLRGYGVEPGKAVGIMGKASLEMIIGILGILKAGGAYLPIDPGYPRERVTYILDDIGAELVLTTGKSPIRPFKNTYRGVNLNINDLDLHSGDNANPQVLNTPADLAYIIYTSGSTGKPKGVMVDHANVVRLAKGAAYIEFSEEDRLLLTGTFMFDITTFEMMWPLLNGLTLCLIKKEDILDIKKLQESVIKNGISVLHLIPQLFNQVSGQVPGMFGCLKYFLVGGDNVTPKYVDDIRNRHPRLRILHMYGPTENTTFSTSFEVEDSYEQRIPIGRPVANSTVYILSPDGNLCPPGTAGELCAGGDGAARGYLNNVDLTHEKFVDNPFKPGERLYRSGDLAKWLPGGNVEFLGRIDEQVKIKGYRVELGEIESHLLTHELINEAVVLAGKSSEEDKYLCAYIVPAKEGKMEQARERNEESIDTPGLRDHLSRVLPEYMIPSFFVRLDTIPLTPSGKINRAALPEPGRVPDEEYRAPGSEIEKKLAEIWKKVLGVERIGVEDNFFMHGGDSIKAIQVSARMKKNGYRVEMRDIFRNPTIMGLAPLVKEEERIADQSPVTGEVKLVPAQRWFFEEKKIDRHHFNQSVMLYSQEGFDKEAIRTVFTKIREHHDVLRMRYIEQNGEMKQVSEGPDQPLSLTEYDLRDEKDEKRELENEAQKIQSGIDLAKGPLMKLGLFHLRDGDRLLIVIHHLVMDGVSWRILFEDIETLSNQYKKREELELPLKTDSFKLWAEKLSEYADSRLFLSERDYWQGIESAEVTGIKRDFVTKGNYLKDMESVSFSLSKNDTNALLTKVNEPFATGINDILLTGLGISIRETFAVKKVPVAMEGHGREEIIKGIDTGRTVGWFTNKYPVILDMSFEEDLARQVREVKESLLQVPNKGMGYGILKYITGSQNKPGFECNCKPRISFNYLGQFDADIDKKSFEIAGERAGSDMSINGERDHDLDISGVISNGQLIISIYYNKHHYRPETMKHLAGSYRDGLNGIISYCTGRTGIALTPGDFLVRGITIDEFDHMVKGRRVRDIYSLSPMQEGMYFHWMYDRSSAYFEQISYRLKEELNISAVRSSLNELVKRHDILRTVFTNDSEKKLFQIVLEEREAGFNYEDITRKPGKEEYIKEFRKKDRDKSFDLSQDALIRVSLLKINDNEYEFLWSNHHILMDGWCMGILIAEFLEIYNSKKMNRPYVLPEVKQYGAYIRWLERQDGELTGKYWRRYLDGYEETAVLPVTGIDRKKEEGYEKEIVDIYIEKDKSGRFRELAARNNVTLNTVFQVLWGILLGKYSNKDDVVFGVVVSGRPSGLKGVESMVGLFINTIPVRIKFGEDVRLRELLKETQQNAVESESHHYYPLAEIQAQSKLKQDLLDHILVFENYPAAEQLDGVFKGNEKKDEKAGFDISNIEIFGQTNYDLNVVVGPGESLNVRFLYNRHRYSREFIEKTALHVEQLFDRVTAGDESYIYELSPLTPGERERLLYEFNNTQAGYPGDKTIHELFEEQVERVPDRIAAVFKEQQLTYGILNEKSAILAEVLRRKGIGPGNAVGLMIDRSLEMITGILGILKSGGAYLPVDPGAPEKRIVHMLNDSKTSVIVTNNKMVNDYSFYGLQRNKETQIVPYLCGNRPQVTGLDTLPFPDRSFVDYEKYNRFIGQAMVMDSISIQATRGCPFKCIYCHKIWPKTQAARSAEHIFSEVRLYYEMGVRRFAFVDDIFNLDVRNSERFFKLIIENKLDIQLFFPNGMRGDILTKEYIDLMVKAGVAGLAIALETASPRLQKLIGKNLDLTKLRENIEYFCTEYPGVILELFTMHGFPTETEEEANQTLAFIKSIKWLHFPYVFISKIYSNSEIAKIALENGVSAEAIEKSENLAFHELPGTLPFEKSFTLKYQAEFLNEYFLDKERLLHVIPYQLKVLTEDELVQKYNSYLPVDIRTFAGLLEFVNITREELNTGAFMPRDHFKVPAFNEKIKRRFQLKRPLPGALNVLLLDLSQYFSSESDMLYDVVDPPLGLMYLMSYLRDQHGDTINGRIVKARIDFDSYAELKEILDEFKPDVIGVRTLTFYRDFFHGTISKIRQWGIDVPVITGGPYATTCFEHILKDRNIDIAVLGEGEITFNEIITGMIENNGKLPGDETLANIKGMCFIPGRLSRESGFNREIYTIDDLHMNGPGKPGVNRANVNKPGDLAYIIYTSGTTGMPKGVMIEHKSVVNLIYSQIAEFNIGVREHILQFSSIAFDASVEQVFISLLSGSVLVLIDKKVMLDEEEFAAFLLKNSITHIHAVPSFLNNVKVRRYDELKRVLSGGDICPSHLAKKWAKEYRFYNRYGPTETTVTSIETAIKDDDNAVAQLPIGAPIKNTKVFILAKMMEPAAIGAAGELYIGGAGVSRGYQNNPELTAEKFIDNPFAERGKLYKTGDLSRWLPGGQVEFLGRIDNQVKVRGYRVELGEIENRLRKHDLIGDVVVSARSDRNEDKYLCAYFVLEEDERSKRTKQQDERTAIDIPGLRDYLSGSLPGYMMPSYFVELERIPLTPNGKVDRRLLPDPERAPGDGYAAPGNELERKLVEIWGDVLGIEKGKISIDANFFELGGHSLKATILISRMHKQFDAKIEMTEVFKRVTIREMGSYIETFLKNESNRQKYIPLKCVEKKEYYELSSAQKRMYLLQQFDIDNTHYNMLNGLELAGRIVMEKLAGTFKQLIRRHESLRTSFEVIKGRPVQKINENVDFEIEYFEAGSIERLATAAYDAGERYALPKKQRQKTRFPQDSRIEGAINDFLRPFDLSKAPLLRVGIIEKEGKNLMLFDLHHIISDGVSHRILAQEFARSYAGKSLAHLPLQYKDYALWQNGMGQGEQVKKQEEFWLKQLAGELPVLHLPADFTRPLKQSFAGSSLVFKLDEFESENIARIAGENDSTLYMVILSIFTILLSKLSSQEDIIIGSPTAGRGHNDLENIIGMFVNTLVMRNYPKGEKRYEEFFREVKSRTVEVYENQDYQFEDLVDKLSVNRDTGRNPIFDVMLNWNENEVGPGNPGDRADDWEKQDGLANIFDNSKFDLCLRPMAIGEKIVLRFEYGTKLFKKRTIERFSVFFKQVVKAVISNRQVKLSGIEIIPEKEKKEMVSKLNRDLHIHPINDTVQDRLAKSFDTHTDKIALEYAGVSLSYGEFWLKSNHISGYIINNRIGKGACIGIYVKNRAACISAMIGILNAGCAFVPLDNRLPLKRIEKMIRTAGVRVIVTDLDLGAALPGTQGVSLVKIDDIFAGHKNGADRAHPNMRYMGKDGIYVFFSSGTTGIPRAVLGKNSGLCQFIDWEVNHLGIDDSCRFSQFTNISFDVCLRDIFAPLFAGGTICVPGKDELIMTGEHIINWIDARQINLIHCVPSLFRLFNTGAAGPGSFKSLKYVLLAGEALKPVNLKKWYERFGDRIQLMNVYGPTETTLFKACYKIKSEDVHRDRIPIGKPIAGASLVLLDKYLNLCPRGVTGEIHIRTPYRSHGYLNGCRLNSGKFIVSPFNQHETIYKTGDLGRELADGNFDILDRVDQQVKLRGNRIELGEIESQLLKHESVKEAVVLIIDEEKRDKYLCAYIVPLGPGNVSPDSPAGEPVLDVPALRDYLSKNLPGYMVPAYFVKTDSIPLTANGKTDRRALLKLEKAPVEEYAAPSGEVEEKLVDTWAEILEIDREVIGVNSDFFELGGHSLKIVELAAKINKEFNVKFAIPELFRVRTIKDIASIISVFHKEENQNIKMKEVII